jgi:hypothetical protein
VNTFFKAREVSAKEDKKRIQSENEQQMKELFNAENPGNDSKQNINRSTFNNSSTLEPGVPRDDSAAAGEVTENKIAEVVMINDREFTLGINDQQDKEILALKSIAYQEQSHGQWVKQAVCLSLIGVVILMNLIIGSSKKASIVGLKDCGFWYWAIQVLFIILCCVITYFMVIYNKRQQDLRKKYNINYVEGEVLFEGVVLKKLLLIGFLGGFVAGALGLGGGSIYNPALLSLGVNPKVASSTGMYLVMFSCINSCIVNYIAGILDVSYGAFIGTWVVVGSLFGNYAADSYAKKKGK